MNDEKKYKIIGYVIASKYRLNILKSLNDTVKTPSLIAKDIDLITNHVSNVLKDLKEKNLVVCLNEEAHKGRLYKNTDLAIEILKYIE